MTNTSETIRRKVFIEARTPKTPEEIECWLKLRDDCSIFTLRTGWKEKSNLVVIPYNKRTNSYLKEKKDLMYKVISERMPNVEILIGRVLKPKDSKK